MRQINYNPGMCGFVKAHRHPSGASLVMSRYDDAGVEVVEIYWTKRLHHTSIPIHRHVFQVLNERSLDAAELTYRYLLDYGPPDVACCDYQKDRVYRWEDECIYPRYRKLSWVGCQRFAREVWARVGAGSIDVTKHRRLFDATAFVNEIHLPERDKWGDIGYFWKKPVILHEIAHMLASDVPHGRRFVAIYINLCERFLGYDREYLEATADAYRVHYE